MQNSTYESIKNELFSNILPYWEKHSRDTRPGFEGFFGQIDNDNNKNAACERSIVMTSRFLWTYSAISRLKNDKKYLEMADFAYEVIKSKFVDKKNGGVYWSVMPDGKPKIEKKQIYGEAFCVYGLSEYAAAIAPSEKAEEVMNLALDIYNLIENHAHDTEEGGYIEACAKNWKPTDDMILSPKDMNCPKSMNTNLHVMEAYTNLYRTLPVVFPDAGPVRAEVADVLADLVRVTTQFILQPNAHLSMFFDMHWNCLSDEISYGHDIEASWLLWEAACELGDEELKNEIHDTVIKVAEVSLEEGFDHQNGCLENFLKDGGRTRDRRRVWWNQAESMNGFYNAWEMTKDSKFEKACEQQWKWIIEHQADKNGGDWWSELDESGKPILAESKGGNWKTSYHNARACMEILRRAGKF